MRLLYYTPFLFLLSCYSSISKNGSSLSVSKPSDLKVIDSLHPLLGDAKEGDWLYHHDESGQSFKEYIKSSPNIPDTKRSRIVLLPIGAFSAEDSIVIDQTADYLELFLGLKTEILPCIPDSVFPQSAQRVNGGILQLHTKYILDEVLIPSLPDSAFVYMAITNKDLFPYHNWNYVFGQAYYRKRVGVSSIYRLGNDSLLKKRLFKLSSHELIHMFSIKHCIDRSCVVNGSNSLYEMDKKPLTLCSSCLSKLTWNLQYDPAKRFALLQEFHTKHGFHEEILYYGEGLALLYGVD